ncbi:MAG TPA: NTP transferase domain-containing protein [Jatrophihabitantaceae bacterium]|nr:NTP transferase domain-containing protein [Jatrophihabitantaceae bacterium]
MDALVLSGGRALRMGGAKPELEVGGVPLLARVTAALTSVDTVVVVGPTVPGARADVVCSEEPPGAGPVAAVAAGMRHVRAPVVLLLGADLPFLTTDAVAALLRALGDADRAVAVDDTGREQPLLSAWRTTALAAALRRVEPHRGAALRRLTAEWSVLMGLPGDPPPWWDCDDPDDLARARAVLTGGGPDGVR